MKKHKLIGRRKFLFGLTGLSLGGLAFAYNLFSQPQAVAQTNAKPIPKPNARLGINISGIAYWGSEYPFVDLMHQSGDWVSQPPKGRWGTGPALTLDAHGWVKSLADGCKATKILCAGDGNTYPTGTFVILYDGEGEIKLNSPKSRLIKSSNGRIEVAIDSKKNLAMLAIDIVSTNPKNYLRNIRVIMPGFESSYKTNPWHPDFLKRWSGVACLRFMDMMKVNSSSQMNWADRPQLQDASYAEKGVPIELLIDLANRLEADAWFCMPHQANDDYIKQFATVVSNTLQPALKAWVEYSNEVWNSGFKQYAYAAMQGQKLNFGSNQWESAYYYNAHRTLEIFNIWTSVYAGTSSERLVKVIASQAANSYLSDQLLKLKGLGSAADVLAVAPYVSCNVPQSSNKAGISAKKVAQWDLGQLFDYINNTALPETKSWILESKKVADSHGVKLVAYEAGQHLVGIAGAENNKQLTQLLTAANADARMGDIYTKHLQHWLAAGGDLMCMFNSVEHWSKWGSWGLLQHTKDTVADSPKYKAVIDWAKTRGQNMTYLNKTDQDK